MTQLAAYLEDHMKVTVVDATGLPGGYDALISLPANFAEAEVGKALAGSGLSLEKENPNL
jgi:uncharacterized protein (TIGR03435 family)